jgi:hypothetical protein
VHHGCEAESKGIRVRKGTVERKKVRDAWREDQPSAEQENEFIRAHELELYAKWHLNVVATQICGGQTELLLCKATFFFVFRQPVHGGFVVVGVRLQQPWRFETSS